MTISNEELTKELNEHMKWARDQADTNNLVRVSMTREGPLGNAGARLVPILKELGYIENRGTTGPKPLWWVKPDGEITSKMVQGARARLQAKRAPSDLEQENAHLRRRLAKLEALLQDLRSQLDASLTEIE